MSASVYQALVLNEWRLRSRRVSSLVILLAVVVLSWLMVLDPKTGMAMMVVHKQRLAYDSQALSFGTTLLASLLFGLAGFYLARGRRGLALRCHELMARLELMSDQEIRDRGPMLVAVLEVVEVHIGVAGSV